jgi:transcription elongation factor Elf1
MVCFDFNPFGNESLVLKFECDKCRYNVISEEINIPQPDYSADTAHDSQTDDEGYAVCDNCGKEFHISVHSTYAGGNGYIEDLQDDWEIDVAENPEPYYEDQYEAISSNNLFFATFAREIENLKKLNEIKLDDYSLENTLKRQLYIGVIASMETYLSDAFINTTLNSENFIKEFVKSFNKFKGISIKLNELFEHYDKIKVTCRQFMLEVIYHNLPKVKKMYKGTLGVDLGDIGILFKAVSTRHDLVHRNGKTKDGEEFVVNSEIINQLISDISDFVDGVNKQIENLSSNS